MGDPTFSLTHILQALGPWAPPVIAAVILWRFVLRHLVDKLVELLALVAQTVASLGNSLVNLRDSLVQAERLAAAMRETAKLMGINHVDGPRSTRRRIQTDGEDSARPDRSSHGNDERHPGDSTS